ncbi:hypothetical protein BC829DRAFT_391176 [Chytridium lagenaria]|nr:hypothetical protein BC829DRAFT_391176 [Chytridium lagenaria]
MQSTSTNRYTRAYRNTETLNAMNTAQGIRFDVMANKVESNVAVGIDPMVTENEKNTREQIWAADCTMKDLFCLKDQLDMEVSECKRLEKQKSDLKYKVDRQVQLLFERCDLLKMPLDEENLFFCKIEKAKNAVEQLVAANRQSKENARKLQRELRNRYNEQEYFLKKQAEIKQQFDALKDSMRSYR